MGEGEKISERISELVRKVEEAHPHLRGHQERVSKLTLAAARILGLPRREALKAGLSALLHDVGKIFVPSKLLSQPRRLSPEEFEKVKEHCWRGFEMVLEIPLLAPAGPGVLSHHERFDGKGYPEGRRGEEIPLEARVVAASDLLDAVMHERPHRPALPEEEALRLLKVAAGKQLDPEAAKAVAEARMRRMEVEEPEVLIRELLEDEVLFLRDAASKFLFSFLGEFARLFGGVVATRLERVLNESLERGGVLLRLTKFAVQGPLGELPDEVENLRALLKEVTMAVSKVVGEVVAGRMRGAALSSLEEPQQEALIRYEVLPVASDPRARV